MNVTQLRSAPAACQQASGTMIPHREWISLLQKELRKRHYGGLKIKVIAEKTGLSHSTISNMISGETNFPRMATVVKIMVYLGYDLFAMRKH